MKIRFAGWAVLLLLSLGSCHAKLKHTLVPPRRRRAGGMGKGGAGQGAGLGMGVEDAEGGGAGQRGQFAGLRERLQRLHEHTADVLGGRNHSRPDAVAALLSDPADEHQQQLPGASTAAQDSAMSDAGVRAWVQRVHDKLACLRLPQRGALFHYHCRKAAGTTLREMLKAAARAAEAEMGSRSKSRLRAASAPGRLPLYELEGRVLDAAFLEEFGGMATDASAGGAGSTAPAGLEAEASVGDGGREGGAGGGGGGTLLLLTSLRHPVARILSLYWYEHVAWFDEVVKKPHQLQPLDVWLEAWREGGTFRGDAHWKYKFSARFPDNVYVDVENYYVKAFGGWRGGTGKPPDYPALFAAAKRNLEAFDVLLVSEWLGNASSSDALAYLLEGTVPRPAGVSPVMPGVKAVGGVGAAVRSLSGSSRPMVASNKAARDRLKGKLIADEASTMRRVAELNQWDVRLYAYARGLVRRRTDAVLALSKSDVAVLQQPEGQRDVSSAASSSYRAAQCPAAVAGLPAPRYASRVYGFHPRGATEHHNQPAFAGDKQLPALFKRNVGMFQPPGHKGPL